MIKSVCGYEGLYEVDEHGNVYSTRNKRKLKPILMESGYEYVHLCNGKNNTILKRVHRIVAEAFIPNPMNYEQVNHKDGNKNNNFVENLEWCDGFYNMQHAVNNNLLKNKGADNPSAKLNWETVGKIRKEYVRGSKKYGTTALAKKYKVSNVMVGKIVKYENWKIE